VNCETPSVHWMYIFFRLFQKEEVGPMYSLALLVQGGPKKLCISQHTIFLEPFKIKLNGFHQNVPRVSKNKN